jgi:hypothetical protein
MGNRFAVKSGPTPLQEVLFQKFRAAIPKGTIPTDAECQALILKLKKEQDMSEVSAEQPADS